MPNGNLLSIISEKSRSAMASGVAGSGYSYLRMCLFSSLCADFCPDKFSSRGLHAHIVFCPLMATSSSRMSLLAPDQWEESFFSPTVPVKNPEPIPHWSKWSQVPISKPVLWLRSTGTLISWIIWNLELEGGKEGQPAPSKLDRELSQEWFPKEKSVLLL